MEQATVTTATVHDLREANKNLRFAKANKATTLTFPSLRNYGVKTWDDVGLLALSDAAWGTRPDGSSQGGYLILLVPTIAFQDQMTSYAILDWRSMKLPRVARSSLSAETQAAATAADSLEMVKTFMALMRHPRTSGPKLLEPALRQTIPSALVVDAKSLYDAYHKESTIQASTCKRTAIEMLVLKQTLQLTSTVLRWVSSERQLADGLTKVAARQLLAERLQSQMYRMVHDSTFTAAKKKPLSVRRVKKKA
jgi:hypothetical protein